MSRPTYLLLFTVLSYLLLFNSSQQFFVFRLIMLAWKTVKEQKSRMIGWTVKMPWLSQQSHLVWELTKDQSDLLFIGVPHRVLQVINFHMTMWTQLIGRLFSPSQKLKKWTHPFRLCFELGMGIAVFHHTKY